MKTKARQIDRNFWGAFLFNIPSFLLIAHSSMFLRVWMKSAV